QRRHLRKLRTPKSSVDGGRICGIRGSSRPQMEYTSLHMKWASAASDRAELAAAIEEAAAAVRRQLGECPADLIIAFVSIHHAGAYGEVPARLRDALGDGLLLGCSAGGVIGGGHEIEQRPGVAL